MFTDFILAIIGFIFFVLMIRFVIFLIKKIKIALKPHNDTNDEPYYVSYDNMNTFQRSDNKPISNEEIPNLIKSGLYHALSKENQSKNIKFHRTDKEEELSFRFEMNHSDEIDKHIDSFENCYSLACATKDLNKKIELLEKTIIKFEKARTWFYRTKGGTIYFQDMYEHLHNSKNNDFSYIDQVERDLNECIRKRNDMK